MKKFERSGVRRRVGWAVLPTFFCCGTSWDTSQYACLTFSLLMWLVTLIDFHMHYIAFQEEILLDHGV